MGRPESDFPTIQDLRDRLSDLVDRGLGDLAVQVLIVPDSTIQAVAKSSGAKADDRPALMIELGGTDTKMPVSLISTDRLSGGGMSSVRPS